MRKMVLCCLLCVSVLALGGCKNTEKGQGGLSKSVSENGISLPSGKTLKKLKSVGEDGPYYCNLPENMTGTYSYMPEEYPVLVCKDPVYDITYYVNYGRDYYIYAKRGEDSECVVEIPARDLYCRQGVLYFRTEDYETYEFDSFADGAILTYDPTDGSVVALINEPTFEMMVYPDGILYAVNEEYLNEEGMQSATRHLFFYSFENEESEELPPPLRTVSRWKEYQLVADISEDDDRTVVGYCFETPQGESEGLSVDWTKLPSSFCITEDGIYYIDIKKDILMYYDVESDVSKSVVSLGFPSNFPNGFLLSEEAIYFTNGIRYSYADKKQYLVKIREKESAKITNFYTDGDELFVLADGKLWLYEEEKVKESGYTTSQISGRSVIAGCYEAVLHPLGE